MIAIDKIVDVLEIASDGVTMYFDRKDNKIILVTEDDLHAAEQKSTANVPEWQQETVAAIKCIENDNEERFLTMPTSFDIHEWDIMRQFSFSITDAEISQQLENSLHGNGAFRMFKDCLARHNLQEQWYKYRADALRIIAIDWCKDNGIRYSSEMDLTKR